ncbi:MAG: TRAP transporter substrate-binding protein [Desulfobacteraceae bacterium]
MKALKMKALLMATALMCTVFFHVSSVDAGSVQLNYANFPPEPTFPCVQMERWKKEVEKRTDGKVKINTYPGGTLLGAKDMMDGVIAGQADIGNVCMAYQPGRFTVTNGVSLPVRIPDAKTGSLVLLDLYNRFKPEAFDKVKVLAMFTTAPANIMSKKPIRTLDDLKSLDLRASGGASRILEIWGANQIGMPMSATPEALQKGVVQGIFSSLEVMKDLKFAEDCKYVTMTQTVVYPFAVVMNLNSWNALDDDVKQVMNSMIEEQSLWTGEYMDAHITEAVQWSKNEQDVEFINLGSQELQKWNSKLSPIIDNWVANADEKGIDGESVVKFIRERIEKRSQ